MVYLLVIRRIVIFRLELDANRLHILTERHHFLANLGQSCHCGRLVLFQPLGRFVPALQLIRHRLARGGQLGQLRLQPAIVRVHDGRHVGHDEQPTARHHHGYPEAHVGSARRRHEAVGAGRGVVRMMATTAETRVRTRVAGLAQDLALALMADLELRGFRLCADCNKPTKSKLKRK